MDSKVIAAYLDALVCAVIANTEAVRKYSNEDINEAKRRAQWALQAARELAEKAAE